MSANTSYRLSGIALLLGAALSVVNLVIQGWYLTGTDMATILSPLSFFSNVIAVVGGILVLLGLPGMYARQAERAGILGLLGFVFVWYVSLVQNVLLSWGNLTVMSDMSAHITPQKLEIIMTPPPVWGPFFTLSMVGEALGILLLGIAILRAGVFPRWTGWAFIATLVLGLASFAPFVPEAVSNLTGIVAAIPLAGIGLALLAPAHGESTQTTSVTASVVASA